MQLIISCKEDENTKLSSKSGTKEYESIDNEIDEKYLYELDKLSLDGIHKE